MAGIPKPIPVRFYRQLSGAEPTRDWLRRFEPDDRAILGADLRRLQFGWPLGLPLCRPMGGGLWEIRSSLPGRREIRLFFCLRDDLIVILHGIQKMSRATPKLDLDLARQRMKDVVEWKTPISAPPSKTS